MAMNYATFKTWFLASIWRTNDTVVSNNLDTIIDMATDELDQLTRDWDRRQVTVEIAPETEDFNLTAGVTDFQAVLSLVNNADSERNNPYRFTTKADLYSKRQKYGSETALPWYTTDRAGDVRYLRLIGPFSAAAPGDFTLMYRASLPDYSDANESWLEDEYLNVYQYAIAKHAALFVREDERIQLYSGLFAEQFETANTDDKHNLQFGGSPLQMKPHRKVP